MKSTDEEAVLSLPFLTRQMLNLPHGSFFDVEVEFLANIAEEVEIVGFTKHEIFNFKHTHAGDGTVETDTFRTSDIPLGVSVHTTSATVERGEYWVALYLRVNRERIMKLCSGYVSRQSSIAWPQVQSENELGKRGNFKIVSVSNPAAGADFSEAVPTGEHWIIQFVTLTFATSAVGGARNVHMTFAPNATATPLDHFADTTQTQNLTRQLNFHTAGFTSDRLDADQVLVNISPKIHLLAGGLVASAILNIQVADQLSDIEIYVEQFMAI